MAGTLYLVATPIGNLEDMTARAIRILKEADLIAAEDTRNSMKLLTHFDIHTPMTSYHEFNKHEKAKELVEKLLEGKNIACITDAGTPGISDPGYELVCYAAEAGITVTAVPGCVAATTALTLSGLSTRRFAFEGFLPADKKECRDRINELKEETRTFVIYEAPHRLLKTLKLLLEGLGDRKISFCRELTKKHEEIIRTTISEGIRHFEENAPKGEFVLCIEGADKSQIEAVRQMTWQELSIEEHMKMYLDCGMEKTAAMKQVAKDRGLSKRDVYQALLGQEK